jgi:hypothetical protein
MVFHHIDPQTPNSQLRVWVFLVRILQRNSTLARAEYLMCVVRLCSLLRWWLILGLILRSFCSLSVEDRRGVFFMLFKETILPFPCQLKSFSVLNYFPQFIGDLQQ